MANDEPKTIRSFKTKAFSSLAKKAGIADEELCAAIAELNRGIWDADLGGEVYKKRLNKNMHRAILLHKVGSFWIFAHLFAKSTTANIKKDELQAFKELSGDYKRLTDKQLESLVSNRELLEICHDCKKEV